MARIEKLPPNAEQMINSMRSLGYSFQTALADVIDNSVSAGATRVEIITPACDVEDTYLAILDDGCGMNEEALIESMRHASKNPEEQRRDSDLGRFGLGMKTASLSQCRELIVISKTSEGINSAGWSIDTIKEHKDWALSVFEENEYKCFPCYEMLEKLEHGTLLIWREFDNLEAKNGDVFQALTGKLEEARDHLGLVYHRLITDHDDPVEFSVNGRPIDAKDPFLENRKGGADAYPAEQIFIDGFDTPIIVTGYTLPHQNKISNAQMDSLGLRGRSFGDDQGFYIYRGKRLIFWGGWLRLSRKAQASKLCRVCVDVPNSMDKIWDLDIKKSVAIPPKIVREKLSEYLSLLVQKSQKIQSGRGVSVLREKRPENVVWDACQAGKNRFSVRINRTSLLYKEFVDTLDPHQKKLFAAYTGMLELYYPSRWVAAQYEDDKSSSFADQQDTKSKDLLKSIVEIYKDDALTEEDKKLLIQILTDNAEVGDNKQLVETTLKEIKKW